MPDVTLKGAVCGRLLFYLDSSLTQQDTSDVLNSTLLAALVADKAFPDGDFTDWTDRFSSTLGSLAWNIQSFDHRTVPVFKLIGAALATARNEMLKDNLFSPDEINRLVQLTLPLTTADADSVLDVVFNQTSVAPDKKGALFGIGIARRTNDQPILQLYLFGYDGVQKVSVTNPLGFSWTDQTFTFNLTSYVMVLNEQIYATIRDTIIKKLHGKPMEKQVRFEVEFGTARPTEPIEPIPIEPSEKSIKRVY